MHFLNPRLAADIFDGEYIIANLDTGLYYSVQGIAVSLLNALPFQDPEQVVNALMAAFPEHAGSIKQELPSIVNELLKEDIIQQDDRQETTETPSWSAPEAYAPGRFNRYADMQDLLLLDPVHEVDENGWTVQNAGS